MSFLLQLLSSRAVRPALDSLVMGPPPEEEIEAPVDAVPSPLKALPLHPRPPTQPKPPSHRSRSFRHIKHGTLADRDNKIRALFRKNYHVVCANKSSPDSDIFLFPKDSQILGEGAYSKVFSAFLIPAEVTPASISGLVDLTNSKISRVAVKVFCKGKKEQDIKLCDHEWTILKHVERYSVDQLANPLLPVARLDKTPYYDSPALIFPFVDNDLFKYLQDLPLSSDRSNRLLITQDFGRQLLEQVVTMHSLNIHHRDLKPANILLKDELLKITDLGSSTLALPGPIHSHNAKYPYIITRWYRPPEVLLKLFPYTEKVDIWSVALILMEVVYGEQILPGKNADHQLQLIRNFLGLSTKQPPSRIHISRRTVPMLPLRKRLLNRNIRDADFIDLMEKSLRWNPEKRLSAEAMLAHPFFTTPISEHPYIDDTEKE
ncbi:MAG: serine/threonine-protein kinase [Waddliaceae bacterium]|jgi:serine/threonine protein kinase|nr:serine/threonine-protein kinase [Waddliaceae bacterium]MBT3578738.1 serine/threonine-protein kinase [Waddliaceae bacterium]MBT4444360.1 serine/threonine-protein kinase [Waddliaceae bacterium]MBT6928275.1 serine/threonine-protein kinase [Waddliaceae bacterium]MBT7264961.1 serine/threonine-protein kinase [Waddliaceae bacterium]